MSRENLELESVVDPPRTPHQPLILREWKTKIKVTVGILVYYIGGYFSFNRLIALPDEAYHDVVQVPFLDSLPIIPWTIVVYNSVFVLGALGIWLLPDKQSLRRYFLSVLLSYTLNYLFFAFYPTRIERAPIPEEGSMWLWALRWTRSVDGPYTCFPSLHITNCVVAVMGLRGTRHGPWFLAWTVAIAASTLTTDQHLFLDLPAGAVMALAGSSLARAILDRRRQLPAGRSSQASS